jgi:hypothetical protein
MIAGAYRVPTVVFTEREQVERYLVTKHGFMDYRVTDITTGRTGTAWRSEREAIIDAHGLCIRNMMH